jgi:hypothetical protein
VRRGSHELLLEGRDTTPLFLETLFLEGFKPACVDEMEISPGERIPAFFIDGGIAHFGWIFWEVFSPGRMRRIFGSVARNEKGDWAIVLGKGNKQILYTNIELKELMDVEHPSAF